MKINRIYPHSFSVITVVTAELVYKILFNAITSPIKWPGLFDIFKNYYFILLLILVGQQVGFFFEKKGLGK